MGTKGNTFITLRDLASGLKGDKTFDHEVVELMAEVNDILDDIPFTEANDGTSNITTIRTGLPKAQWVAHYQGVQASKGSKQQIRNTAGMMATKLEIAKTLFDSDQNKEAVYRDELESHLETMGNEAAEAFFYGSIQGEARKFNGLGTFYSVYGSSGMDDREASHFVFNGAKASNPSGTARRSIWLLNWGPKTMRGFYPKGSKGGIQKGEFKTVEVVDPDGGTYEAYRQYFYWNLGMDVRDFRYGGRIANIEAELMLAAGQPDYVKLIDQLDTRVRSGAGTRRCFYMSKIVWENIKVLFGTATRSNAITYADVNQRLKVPMLFGVPVRMCDALNTNEDAVASV